MAQDTNPTNPQNPRPDVYSLLKSSTVWVLALATIVVVFIPGDHMAKLKLAIGFGLMVLIFLFGFMILLEIAAGRINLSLLLSTFEQAAQFGELVVLATLGRAAEQAIALARPVNLAGKTVIGQIGRASC